MSTDSGRGIFQVGDVLNNTYRIEKVLGHGGTSEVYRARSEISGRVMALKALRREYSRNEDFLALMTREEDMREIRHDAIVRYYDNQRTDDGLIYLVMDYVDGPGLDTKLKEGGMSADDILVICRRVAEGLVAAHTKNIVHRDLSPDNIILRNGRPAEAVIIDFGIAKDTNPGAETIVGNEFAGKYAYAAPEQLNGQTDARADIYALGALLLATFRGKAPAIGSNPMEIVERKKHPLDTSGVPEPLKSLIDHMTTPNREDRLQSAEAVLGELDNRPAATVASGIELEQTVVVPRSSQGARPVAPKPDEPSGKQTPPKPGKPRKSGGFMGLLLATGILLAAAIGAYVSGALDGLLGSRYPTADPYSFIAAKTETGDVVAVGFAPSENVQMGLTAFIEQIGGTADISLASGNIVDTWGADIQQLISTAQALPEWQIQANANQVHITGLADNTKQQQLIFSLLAGIGQLDGLDITVEIELGPRILQPAAMIPILAQYSDCGDLRLLDPPTIGYGNGAQVIVVGRASGTGTRVGLSDAMLSVIGNRDLLLDIEVLNPTLCLIDSALPNVREGGFEIEFKLGSDNLDNPTGHFFVGENPMIDISIPAQVTSGFLFVSALDVSGNIFHLLPNLLFNGNSIENLRNGRTGRITVRVAYSLEEASDGSKLAFVVDDSSLGKTKIMVIHSDTPIFDGLRPTTESAEGFAEALRTRSGTVLSLDSRILTTAIKP